MIQVIFNRVDQRVARLSQNNIAEKIAQKYELSTSNIERIIEGDKFIIEVARDDVEVSSLIDVTLESLNNYAEHVETIDK